MATLSKTTFPWSYDSTGLLGSESFASASSDVDIARTDFLLSCNFGRRCHTLVDLLQKT